jgi:threonine dehydrogenase-like Zn-dependent dehydrogenase
LEEGFVKALVFRLHPLRIALAKVLGIFSDRAYLGALSALRYEEIPEPGLPAGDWVRIRTRYCGICGSDYKQVFAEGNLDNPMTALISFPQVLGHEVVGTIEEVGPAVRERKVGERVVLNPWLSCGPRGVVPACRSCVRGDYSRCYNFHKGTLPPGIHTGNSSMATGGFAPRVPAHESMCIPVPDRLSDEQAVLADPFSVSLHAVLNFPPGDEDTVLVYGCGTLGLMNIAILRVLHPKTRVLAVYRYDHQKELAKRFGAAETIPWRPRNAIVPRVGAITGAECLVPRFGTPMLNGGVQTVYDSVGSRETMETSVRLCDYRGRIVITGVGTPRRFEWTPLYFKELAVIGSNAFGMETLGGERKHAFEHYFDLVRHQGLDVTPVLTHRFPLDRHAEAFLACRRQGRSGAVKVLFAHD